MPATATRIDRNAVKVALARVRFAESLKGCMYVNQGDLPADDADIIRMAEEALRLFIKNPTDADVAALVAEFS